MRGVLLLAALWLSVQQNPSGVIRVTVQVPVTLEAIPGVEVIVTPMPSSPGPGLAGATTGVLASGPSFTAVTDAGGIAVIRNLAAGRYFVTAQREGYVGGVNIPGVIVLPNSSAPAVIAAQTSSQELTLFLSPGATVSGRITNANGPAVNARVSITILGYRAGRRTLLPGPTAMTDTRGEYRLTSVGSGEYYVRAEQGASPGAEAYYPGAGDIQGATAIPVRADEDVVGIDFDLPRIPRFRVSGKVLNAPSSIFSFSYAPRDLATPQPLMSIIPNTQSGPNGEFEVNLPPGSWDLFPMASTAATPTGGIRPRYLTGRISVDVVDRDLSGLIGVVGVTDVQGRFVLPESSRTPGTSLSVARVSLRALDNIPGVFVSQIGTAQPLDADGRFVFSGVPPGKYSLQVLSLPTGCHVSDIRIGSRSVFEDGVIGVGTEPLEPLEITLSPGAGTVDGFVDGVALNASRIVLIPNAPRRQNAMLYRSAAPAPGAFTIRDVAPGEYKIFAWKYLPPGDPEFNADFVAQYEDLGVPLTVRAGLTTSVELKLIE